jgi:hypothetical protein
VLDDVTTEIVVDDGGSSGRGRLTVLRLGWRSADPLAVTLVLTAQPDHPALPRGSWVVLRDFLRYGLEEPTGDGEVRIRPEGAADRVEFELNRPGRPCSVSVPREEVRGFLAATDECVPAGEERSDDALDALIERLLAT